MLEWTGERYLPYIDPSICGAEIHYEHLHRYAFASQYVKNKKVLDLASGEGFGTSILSKNAKCVVGIDIDHAAVLHASTTYTKENISFIEGSIFNIPIEGRKIFDVIVCFEAIEHVREHDILFHEIKRLLKDDGILIISTPNKKVYSDDASYMNPYHQKELYYSEFYELLKKNFQYIYLSGQRVISGSSIYPVSSEETVASFNEFDIVHQGDQFSFLEDEEKEPRYFVAIASNLNLSSEQMQRSYLIDASNVNISLFSNKVTSLTQSLESRDQQILEMSNRVTSLTQSLESRDQQILEMSNRVTSLTQSLESRDQQILEMSNRVTSLTPSLESRDQQILEMSNRVTSLTQSLESRDQQITNLNQEITRLSEQYYALKEENHSLKNSISYRLLAKFHTKIIEPLFPHSSKRRELYDLGLKGGRIVASQGLKKGLTEYKQYRASKKSTSRTSQITSENVRAGTSDISFDRPHEKTIAHLHMQNLQKSTDYVQYSNNAVSLTENDIKCIAFYLPQFHPIPENDQWWGKGFTEWTNVTKALPQFIGHYQPHLPDELGFYDLRLPEIQKRQIELARHYGIYGFCFHYYWFNGKRLLERPLNQFIENKEFNFPFCICWANENWTRRWDGLENEILIAQEHSPENDIEFIRDLEPYLKDPRYIRINGKPLILVYRATLLPEAKETTRRWREYCKAAGIGEIYLVTALVFGCEAPETYGFDAAVEFPPHTMNECNIITGKMQLLNPHFSGNIYNYEEFVVSNKYCTHYPFPCFRTVSPGWDNTARRPNNASVFHGANPDLYKRWLSDATRITKETNPPEEQIVFINAWNEWAEGTHLEPDRKFGYGYLQATADVINETRDPESSSKKKIIIVSHDAHLHGAQMLALHIAKALKGQFHYEVHLLLKSGGILEEEFRKYAVVYNLERDYPTPKSIDKILTSLQSNGISIAICNTVVTGDIVELLNSKKIRTLSLIHELPGVIQQFEQKENAKKIARFADRIIFPAEVVKQKFSEIAAINGMKCNICPQGLFLTNKYKDKRDIARTKLREILAVPSTCKIVLNVGYADSRKGIDLFVKVAQIVIKEHNDVWFVWVGLRDELFLGSIDAEIKKAGLKNRILFPGIRREDIDIFYSGADIFLLTSREDPFPSVVLDAMNARLPVIGFDNAGGFKDIITQSTGILVPYLSVEKMAEAVSAVLKDPELQVQIGNNASDLIERNFCFTDYIYSLLSYLGEDYKKISVILPSYNYERYLPERLESIFAQTYPIYEIIVIDDNSSDGSVKILRNIVENAPIPFKIVVNSKNSGSVFRQWAKGISLTHGEYIWIAEADDLSENQFLEEVTKGFNDNTVVLSYSQSKQIDNKGKITALDYLTYTDDVDQDKWKGNYSRPGVEEICDTLAIKNTIPNVSAVVFKKVEISEIVDDLVRYKVAGDWFFYIWLLRKGSISYLAHSLNLHRRHEQSVTISENAQQHFNEIVNVQDYVKTNFALKPSTEEKVISYREKVHDYLMK